MDPHDVAAILAGAVNTRRLSKLLDALRADPYWTVLDPFEHAPEWLFQMVYLPTGRPYGFRAERLTPETWYFKTGPGTAERDWDALGAMDAPSGKDSVGDGRLGTQEHRLVDLRAA